MIHDRPLSSRPFVIYLFAYIVCSAVTAVGAQGEGQGFIQFEVVAFVGILEL